MNLILTLEKFEKILTEIMKVDTPDGHIASYASFIEKLQGMVKAQSVSLHLERAKKSYVNQKEITEKDLLFGAYRKIKASNITDEDLRTANLQDYTTGNNLTLASIEQRLMALGWKG
jgi:hypothetical protein